MSSFLQLCQRTARELEIPGDGPSSVSNQVGQHEQVVRWVRTSIREIERKHLNWKFMLSLNASFNTVASPAQQDYIITTGAGYTDYSHVDPASIRYYKVSDGVAYEQPLKLITWEDWVTYYQLAYTAQAAQAPAFIVELPDGITWRLSNSPDDIYTITFDYYRLPQDFTNTTDYPDPDLTTVIPYIPARYEDAIVGSAMMKYGRSYEAQDKLADGKELRDAAMNDMVITQLPKMADTSAMGNE